MMNPVLARELNVRMRGRAATVLVTFYSGVLALILWLIYRAAAGRRRSLSTFGASVAPALGRAAFHSVLLVVLLLVCFIVPGVAAGAIAGERERQTLVPLQVSLVKPRQIVVGKLLASFAFIALLIVVTMPIMAASFLLGGVTLGEMVRGTMMVLWIGLALSALSVGISAAARRVQTAIVLSYVLMLGLLFGTLLAFGGEALARRQSHVERLHHGVLWLNPLVATASVLDSARGLDSTLPSPFSPFQTLVPGQENTLRNNVALRGNFGPSATVVTGPNGGRIVVRPNGPVFFGNDQLVKRSGFWWESLLSFGAVSLIAMAGAIRRLRTPTTRFRA